jgi:hexosaminidase
MTEQDFCLIPQPKEARNGHGHFRLDEDTAILLLPGAGEQEHFLARMLQQEIRESAGPSVPILKMARPDRKHNSILLVSDLQAAVAFWGNLPDAANQVSDHGQQAYFVDITPDCVIAGGQGATALHYAVQTLRQIARAQAALWPTLQIVDWPTLAYRGVMMDASRGKVPTLDTLKEVVDQLCLFKANVLQLYTEHTFDFPHHPRIGQGCGPLTEDDMLALDAYARPRGVELMPNLNSFGHCAHMLALPEYQHLAESAAGWSLCPTDEGTYTLLDDLCADLLPAFSSRIFNVGCDETWDLGKGRSAEAVAARGTGRVYLEHIVRLRELAARYGCRIQLWGDILLHYPELVPELPEDVTLLDWHYEAEKDYPSLKVFASSGRPFWVCPGTSSWNTLFPRIENSNGNIRTLARQGAEQGAQGLLNTDWGDNGHYQPLGQCWYGYVYGAEQAWSGGQTEDAAFDRRFGKLFFGPGGEKVAQVMRELGRLNALPGMPLPNASRSIYALLDEPLVGEAAPALPAATLEEIVRVCGEAQDTLRALWAASRDPLSIDEMIYSARMMSYAARKALASQQIRAALAATDGPGGEQLSQAIVTWHALDGELVNLGELFEKLWMARAHRSEIDVTLAYFAALRQRYAAAECWCQERLDQLLAGQTPSYDLGEYARAGADYEVLGQGYWRRWSKLGLLPE